MRFPDPPVPATPLRWATAFAHWGDTFAALSQAKWVLDRQGGASCSLVYIGPDAALAEFCAAQPWIDRCLHSWPRDYAAILARAVHYDTGPAVYWPRVRAGAGDGADFPPAAAVTPTHLSQVYGRNYQAYPLAGATLPRDRAQWAGEWWTAQGFGARRVFLLHPVSVWSQNLAGHWPHWAAAVDWLLAETPHTYVLTGQERLGQWEHARLLDLTGKTPTNMEVLALANLGDGVISTGNSMSLWTVIQGKPGLICGNAALRNPANYFRRFIDRPPNTFLPVAASLGEWQAAAAGWLAERGG